MDMTGISTARVTLFGECAGIVAPGLIAALLCLRILSIAPPRFRIRKSFMPFALTVIEGDLATLSIPQRLLARYPDDVEPRITRFLVRTMKQNIYFLERAVRCFWVEEVYERYDDEICDRKDGVEVVLDVVICDWSNDDDTMARC